MKLGVNMDVIIKNMESVELNAKITNAFLNTQTQKMI